MASEVDCMLEAKRSLLSLSEGPAGSLTWLVMASEVYCMLEAKRSLLSLSAGTTWVSNLASNGL
jgi:hypothetical protein